MSQTFNHVAVTVPGDLLEGTGRDELLGFYAEVLGWCENPDLSIPGRRIFLRAPSDEQYISIRASESPMQTSGYEHLGVALGSEAELRAIHERAAAAAERVAGVELQPIRTKYGGLLHVFRLRFRMPLTLELAYLARDGGGRQ